MPAKRHVSTLTQYAVEYAMEAISHAGTVLAVLSKEGIAMAAEKVSAVGSLFSLLSTISGPCDH
jgi:20S proteasome alpha/beta subunit